MFLLLRITEFESNEQKEPCLLEDDEFKTSRCYLNCKQRIILKWKVFSHLPGEGKTTRDIRPCSDNLHLLRAGRSG
jgi:hypothetical protein